MINKLYLWEKLAKVIWDDRINGSLNNSAHFKISLDCRLIVENNTYSQLAWISSMGYQLFYEIKKNHQ